MYFTFCNNQAGCWFRVSMCVMDNSVEHTRNTGLHNSLFQTNYM